MTTLGWILISIGFVSVLLFGYRFFQDVKWNKQLKTYHQKHMNRLPKVPAMYWLKRVYGLTLSSFAVVTIVACGAFSLPLRENNVYLTAKTVGSAEVLTHLLETSSNQYDRFINDDAWLEAPEAAFDGAEGDESRDYIDTNVQVEGVAEGDIVKTDGYQIYYATRYQNKVRILNILNDGTVEVQEDLDLGDLYTDSMYLTDDQLIIIGYTYEFFYYAPDLVGGELDYWFGGYSVFTGSVKVFDRQSLELVYELETDTNFYQHRLIDNMLYLISNKYIYQDDLVPSFTETKDGETTDSTLDYDRIYYFDEVPFHNMTVLTSINLDTYESSAEGYLGYVYQMYASADGIYTTSTYYPEQIVTDEYTYQDWSKPYTHIVKYGFDPEDQTLIYKANASVAGYIENQYWMDGYDDLFRIVTTQWGTSVNRLFILEENSATQELEVIGSITEGIGKEGANEMVKSVRFNGTKVNIVTYETMDPLYTIDMTDPENPFILPDPIEEQGYNTYLHVWNEDHYLVGIGYDDSWQMKLSVYDTSENNPNPGEPLATYYLAEEDSEGVWNYVYSEALYNPKALMIDVDKGIFAFPVHSYGYEYDEVNGYYHYSYQGLYYLFNIDFSQTNPEDVIGEPTIIAHNEFNYYSGIDRGVYIEVGGKQMVYTLSFAQMVSYDLLTGQVIETITFENMDIYDPYRDEEQPEVNPDPTVDENPDGSEG